MTVPSLEGAVVADKHIAWRICPLIHNEHTRDEDVALELRRLVPRAAA